MRWRYPKIFLNNPTNFRNFDMLSGKHLFGRLLGWEGVPSSAPPLATPLISRQIYIRVD